MITVTLPVKANESPYIVVDIDNGLVLEEHNADQKWYPASLTKLMTAYVTFRAIQSGEIFPGSPVRISAAARRQPPSKMGYRTGVNLRIDAALKIIIIKSANDVSLALAEAVAGNLENFVDRMNFEARRLGLRNTQFANSNGLHNPAQVSSARDMALLSAAIIREFPQYMYMFSAVAIKTAANTHYSYNLLLERFPGTTGMKTGFVCASGYNLVASANSNGRTLVAVVLGRKSQTDRAVSAAKLLTANKEKVSGTRLQPTTQIGNPPRNMRPVLCTQEARAARYDPAANNAVIESPYLQPRQRTGNILDVLTGNIDSPPSDAWITANLAVRGNVPIPRQRPDYDPATGKIRYAAIGIQSTGQVPIPTPRPR